MRRLRIRLANVLYNVAQHLDPDRPVTRVDDNGWLISLAGVPLARVKPGMLMTDDQRRVTWRKP